MEVLDDAKLQKLKELRKILRELIAGGEGDDQMDQADIDGALEDAEEGAESSDEQGLEDAGMEADSAMGQEPMEGDLSEDDKLAEMKRKYFKPAPPKMEPKKGVHKIMAPPPKISVSETVIAPRRKMK